MAQPKRVNSCRLADYRYEKDRAVGVYTQDVSPVLASAAALREQTPGAFTSYDLDMGFQFASIPKLLWLKMQQLGITDNAPAMVRFLQAHKETTGQDFFTTTKRLI
jgi:hypothetical protein